MIVKVGIVREVKITRNMERELDRGEEMKEQESEMDER